MKLGRGGQQSLLARFSRGLASWGEDMEISIPSSLLAKDL